MELDRVAPPSGNLWLAGQQIWLGPLAPAGARRAGPPPLPPPSGEVIEVERTVNASGNVSLGNHIISGEPPLAGQRVTLRLVVTRRVSVRGAITTGGQKIQVGPAHARKTAEATVGADTYQITVEPGITIAAPRTTSRDIRRHKASNYG